MLLGNFHSISLAMLRRKLTGAVVMVVGVGPYRSIRRLWKRCGCMAGIGRRWGSSLRVGHQHRFVLMPRSTTRGLLEGE